MFNPNALISEYIGVLTAKGGTASSTPLITAWVKPGSFRRVLGILALGDMASETIDCVLMRAVDSGGTSPTNVKLATQLAAHASNNDNKIILLNASEADYDPAKPFMALKVTTGGATGGLVAMTLLGSMPREENIAALESSVVQIVK